MSKVIKIYNNTADIRDADMVVIYNQNCGDIIDCKNVVLINGQVSGDIFGCENVLGTLCRDTGNLLEDLNQELFINKSCVSEKICEHDKNIVLDKIKEEVRQWYWQSDKQKLAQDPCVVDAMIDLFVRTINKYKTESEKY